MRLEYQARVVQMRLEYRARVVQMRLEYRARVVQMGGVPSRVVDEAGVRSQVQRVEYREGVQMSTKPG